MTRTVFLFLRTQNTEDLNLLVNISIQTPSLLWRIRLAVDPTEFLVRNRVLAARSDSIAGRIFEGRSDKGRYGGVDKREYENINIYKFV